LIIAIAGLQEPRDTMWEHRATSDFEHEVAASALDLSH